MLWRCHMLLTTLPPCALPDPTSTYEHCSLRGAGLVATLKRCQSKKKSQAKGQLASARKAAASRATLSLGVCSDGTSWLLNKPSTGLLRLRCRKAPPYLPHWWCSTCECCLLRGSQRRRGSRSCGLAASAWAGFTTASTACFFCSAKYLSSGSLKIRTPLVTPILQPLI